MTPAAGAEDHHTAVDARRTGREVGQGPLRRPHAVHRRAHDRAAKHGNAGTVIKALRSSGYDDTITVEVFARDRHFLAYSRDRLRDLWAAA